MKLEKIDKMSDHDLQHNKDYQNYLEQVIQREISHIETDDNDDPFAEGEGVVQKVVHYESCPGATAQNTEQQKEQEQDFDTKVANAKILLKELTDEELKRDQKYIEYKHWYINRISKEVKVSDDDDVFAGTEDVEQIEVSGGCPGM